MNDIIAFDSPAGLPAYLTPSLQTGVTGNIADFGTGGVYSAGNSGATPTGGLGYASATNPTGDAVDPGAGGVGAGGSRRSSGIGWPQSWQASTGA